MNELEAALAYAQSQHKFYLNQLCDFLRLPSVSTLPEHRADIWRTAE